MASALELRHVVAGYGETVVLEDVNLAGACGILVNVSAGPNLTMREFDDIGQVIHEFASEDATVVVGTALDPELQDEVRVTVVATGLNRAVSRQPLREREREPMAAPRPPMRVIRNATTGAVDYVDVPAPARVAVPEARAAEAPSDYLDIPAFLRRQAD